MFEKTGPNVVCREIADGDLEAVVDCLNRNFPERDRKYWEQGLARLKTWEPVPGWPRYGYLLGADGDVVGVLLVLMSRRPRSNGEELRGNISSWCVDRDFRAYASALAMKAIAKKGATYVNLSPARHTLDAMAALGFQPYTIGQTFILPPFWRAAGKRKLERFDPEGSSYALTPFETALLRDHAAAGCLAYVGRGDANDAPFVFQRRTILKRLVPAAHLVYARSPNDLSLYAAAIAKALARHALFVLAYDAIAPFEGVLGGFLRGRERRLFKGAAAPDWCDLAYTELIAFGR